MNKNGKYTAVTVPLGERTYPIYIGDGLLSHAGAMLQKHGVNRSVVIVTDTKVAALYLNIVERSLRRSGFTVRVIVIPAGEKQKSISRAEAIYTQLMKWNIERSSAIVALGGGVIGDLAGFVAATYQRGIGFVQIPTTLLAQVDSSVGGKTGINHPLAKNMIGAFYQPQCVLADTLVLKSLPKRELVCGLGEIVKYGVILDKEFFAFAGSTISRALANDTGVLSEMIRRSCELKAYVVSNDEREQNLRAILNFGHTIGHALERAGNYALVKHGEAVLFGMAAETNIAFRRGMISEAGFRNIERTIGNIPLPKLPQRLFRVKQLIATMMKDKKSKGGDIRMVLPTSVGTVTLPVSVTSGQISEAIDYLKDYAS